jgi:hypothetical protein
LYSTAFIDRHVYVGLTSFWSLGLEYTGSQLTFVLSYDFELTFNNLFCELT